jgi:hypothetical protein
MVTRNRKAPAAAKPAAKKAAPRAAAGPQNQSRGTGPRVPDSAASRSAPPLMYDPGDDIIDDGALDAELEEHIARVSQLGDVDFTEGLHDEADEFEGVDLSADHDITEAAAAEDDGEGPSPEEIRRIRETRKPLGAMSQKLALPTRRGYHRHWFNNVAGRIQEATAAGWAFVRGTDGKPIKRCVGTGRDRNALWAYAMELPLVFWKEDQNAKHDAAYAVMDGLKNRAFDAEKGAMKRADAGKFYDPTEAGTPLRIAER